MLTLSNVKPRRGETPPRCTGLTPDGFPEAGKSSDGVSVRYVPMAGKLWFVLRASYGREDRAAELLTSDGTYTYIAKRHAERHVQGKRKRYLQNLIPNILFVYATAEKVEQYVKRTPALDFLSYYYNHFKLDQEERNIPLTIPEGQMRQFVRATSNMDKHLLFVDASRCHYKSGQLVRVTEGAFTGVEGRVARVAGQQRVVIALGQLGVITTAYIPTAFIQPIGQSNAGSSQSI